MTKQKNQIKNLHEPFALYDSETMPYGEHQHMAHFALTDALTAYAGETNQPVLHFWQTNPLAILGMMDTKIGHFEKGLEVLESYEHEVVVRNSGGLGVVSDSGVLNVSLIFPAKDGRLSIDEGYQLMLDFVREAFSDFPQTIEAYEISNSYCFGDYDLSIEGRKIAGISQRRIKDGVAVMLYVSVNGNQQQRAEMLREFYKKGRDGSEPAGRYPDIRPEVMTTLEEAYQTALNVPEVKKRLLDSLNWHLGEYTQDVDRYFEDGLEKMIRRNTRVFGEKFVKN